MPKAASSLPSAVVGVVRREKEAAQLSDPADEMIQLVDRAGVAWYKHCGKNTLGPGMPSWARIVFAATGSLLAAIPAQGQSTPCLADVQAAASGATGYKLRSGKYCEGALQRYVSSASRIALVGYHQGTLDIRNPRLTSVPLTVTADARPGPIVLRAMSLTSQSRYQMDNVDVVPGRTFHWPVDLVRQAAAATQGPGANINALGVIACSNRCVDRPDTVYWPVAFAADQSSADDGLSLKLRSGVRAENISVTLEPKADTSATHSWRVKDMALTPNGVTTVRLPAGQRAGLYRLTVDARDAETSEPVGALHATIYVPGPRR